MVDGERRIGTEARNYKSRAILRTVVAVANQMMVEVLHTKRASKPMRLVPSVGSLPAAGVVLGDEKLGRTHERDGVPQFA